MKPAHLRILVLIFLAATRSVFGQTTDPAVTLKLLPAPKEVRLGDGFFVVDDKVRIISAHAGEDRNAIEMLGQEIEQRSGVRLNTEEGRKAQKSGVIVLGRLDDSGMRG